MLAVLVLQHEFVHPHLAIRPAAAAPRATRSDRETFLDQGAKAHVLENGHHLRQRRRRFAAAVELEMKAQLRIARPAERADRDVTLAAQSLHGQNIDQGLAGVIAVAIARREGVGIGGQDGGDFRQIADAGPRGGFQLVAPGAGGAHDVGFDHGQIGIGMAARRHPDDVVHARQRRVGEAGIVGRDSSAKGFSQYLAGALAQAGVVALARGVQKHRHESIERVVTHEELHLGTV